MNYSALKCRASELRFLEEKQVFLHQTFGIQFECRIEKLTISSNFRYYHSALSTRALTTQSLRREALLRIRFERDFVDYATHFRIGVLRENSSSSVGSFNSFVSSRRNFLRILNAPTESALYWTQSCTNNPRCFRFCFSEHSFENPMESGGH